MQTSQIESLFSLLPSTPQIVKPTQGKFDDTRSMSKPVDCNPLQDYDAWCVESFLNRAYHLARRLSFEILLLL